MNWPIFFRNLLAIILNIMSIPARMVFDIIASLRFLWEFRDGSGTINFPWEHEWNPFSEDL